jgi:prolyl-tRNA synthetase
LRGVEVGNIFKLGTRYTEALGATFLDESGEPQSVVMGSYGIGVGRLMACIAEACWDDKGLIWPVSVAPFDVYLAGLDLSDDTVSEAAEQLYSELTGGAVEVLFGLAGYAGPSDGKPPDGCAKRRRASPAERHGECSGFCF